jgi:hypothetical protein
MTCPIRRGRSTGLDRARNSLPRSRKIAYYYRMSGT